MRKIWLICPEGTGLYVTRNISSPDPLHHLGCLERKYLDSAEEVTRPLRQWSQCGLVRAREAYGSNTPSLISAGPIQVAHPSGSFRDTNVLEWPIVLFQRCQHVCSKALAAQIHNQPFRAGTTCVYG